MKSAREVTCEYCSKSIKPLKKRRWDNLYLCDCGARACEKVDFVSFSKAGETSIGIYWRQQK